MLDAGLIAVITPETVAQNKPINSIMTGAQAGEMLQQIAEVEFPQMFRYYRTAPAYEEPKEGSKRLTLELALQHYVGNPLSMRTKKAFAKLRADLAATLEKI